MKLKIPTNTPGCSKLISIELNKSDGESICKFSYDLDLIAEIKVMDGARWHPEERYWTIKDSDRNRYALGLLDANRNYKEFFPYNRQANLTLDWKRKLYVHQLAGVEYGVRLKRCLLAFEMGLGKTLTTIEIMERATQHGHSHWWLVAPFGAQQVWKRELVKWQATIHPIVITTYESLKGWMENIEEVPDGVIFDESVKIKNPSAIRSQVASELCRLIREKDGYIILLSGAPAPKDPTDWWHQIECLQPGFIRESNIYKFRERYANIVYEEGEFGTYPKLESWKEEEVSALGKRISPIVLVKRKKDCLNLPDKIFEVIKCEPPKDLINAALYIVKSAATALEALEKVRQLSDGFQYEHNDVKFGTSNKLKVIDELCDFYNLDNGGCGRLVIYAPYKASIDLLKKYITDKKWLVDTITGEGWSSKDILDYFDNWQGNYCVIANPACVYGLSFTRTEALVFYSNSFSVDHRIQAIERRDRPGMDVQKCTRIVDIVNLQSDEYILEKLKSGVHIQSLTLKEIEECLQKEIKNDN